MRLINKIHDLLPNNLLLVPALPPLPLPSTTIEGVGLYTLDTLMVYATSTFTRNTFVVYDNTDFNSILDEMKASLDPTVNAFAKRLTVMRDQVYGPPAIASPEEVFLSNEEVDEEEQSQAPTAD